MVPKFGEGFFNADLGLTSRLRIAPKENGMPSEVLQRQATKAGPIDPNLEYHLKNADTPMHHQFNNLDAIAKYIMAMSHTAIVKGPEGKDEDKKEKAVVQVNIGTGIKTVAVVRSGSTLLVTQNGIFKSLASSKRGAFIDELCKAVLAELGGKSVVQKVEVLNSASDDFAFHAEMQLLEHCITSGRQISGGVMGVSKPCCVDCAKKLMEAGVDFSLWIDKSKAEGKNKWTPPSSDLKKLKVEEDPHNFAWRDVSLSASEENAKAALLS